FFSSRRRHTRFSRDWSSDVCSSDLVPGRKCWAETRRDREREGGGAVAQAGGENQTRQSHCVEDELNAGVAGHIVSGPAQGVVRKIGRASCRERVYVWVSGVQGERKP